MKPASLLRCAVYTRVSTEHGLEQEFNSLDAQREASEAYIRSQAHEGWRLVRDHFDDGGYSGGSMERPALQALLDAVRARRLDIVVVYKVDRLTRSLADFAKLVELFDAHGVSFVSVTQSFNTTSSMGRLTLNVLLSFAQFEREVTGERIRDKIAASKKKGLWMGGIVPYGYRLKNRKLVIDPPEAEQVRQIFALYLDLKSLPRLAQELADRGLRSRPRRFASGAPIGGKPFRTGALSHLLGNRMYLGEINHKGLSYPGEHDAIIAPDTFAAVQALLAQRRINTRTSSGKSQALLSGLIFDDRGNRMTPVHASKGQIRYRYYQSWVLNHGQKEKAGSISRVAAGDVETLVLEALAKRRPAIPVLDQDPQSLREAVCSAICKVTIHPHTIAITLKRPSCQSGGGDGRSSVDTGDVMVNDATQSETLMIPWAKPSQSRNCQHLPPEGDQLADQPTKTESNARLIIALAQSHFWLGQLVKGNVADIATLAKRHHRSERSVRSLLSLAFLAPDIVDAIVTNQLSGGLGITDFVDLPSDWSEQRRQLGLH